jgi:hypothetical protein
MGVTTAGLVGAGGGIMAAVLALNSIQLTDQQRGQPLIFPIVSKASWRNC